MIHQQCDPADDLDGVGVYLVYLSRRELPRAVKAFIDFNVARIRERVGAILARQRE